MTRQQKLSTKSIDRSTSSARLGRSRARAAALAHLVVTHRCLLVARVLSSPSHGADRCTPRKGRVGASARRGRAESAHLHASAPPPEVGGGRRSLAAIADAALQRLLRFAPPSQSAESALSTRSKGRFPALCAANRPFSRVELRGFDPLTFSLRTRRATNCATAPDAPLDDAVGNVSTSPRRAPNRLRQLPTRPPEPPTQRPEVTTRRSVRSRRRGARRRPCAPSGQHDRPRRPPGRSGRPRRCDPRSTRRCRPGRWCAPCGGWPPAC